MQPFFLTWPSTIRRNQPPLLDMFALDKAQSEKLAAWSKEQDAKALELQRSLIFPDEFHQPTSGGKHPYVGAIGGAYTYSFTPTSLSTVIKVTNGLTGETIDLTDYAAW